MKLVVDANIVSPIRHARNKIPLRNSSGWYRIKFRKNECIGIIEVS